MTLDSLENLKKFLLEWTVKDKERYEAFDWTIEVREIVIDYASYKKDGLDILGTTYIKLESVLDDN